MREGRSEGGGWNKTHTSKFHDAALKGGFNICTVAPKHPFSEALLAFAGTSSDKDDEKKKETDTPTAPAPRSLSLSPSCSVALGPLPMLLKMTIL